MSGCDRVLFALFCFNLALAVLLAITQTISVSVLNFIAAAFLAWATWGMK